MFDYRANLLAALGLLTGVVACDNPVQGTDLRTSGAPNVTAVLVKKSSGNDLSRTVFIGEEATYCRKGDDKRPNLLTYTPASALIEVCPEDLAVGAKNEGVVESDPDEWGIRVVFDQLLDPTIEEIEDVVGQKNKTGTIRNTRPVVVKCNGVEVEYDGYYVPNGNIVSWPPGPSLYISPKLTDNAPTLNTVAANSNCTVELTDFITNKRGEPVPEAQRTGYKFVTAKVGMNETLPGAVAINKAADVPRRSATSVVYLGFNGALAELPAPGSIQLFTGDNGTAEVNGKVTDVPNLDVCAGTAGVVGSSAVEFDTAEKSDGTIEAVPRILTVIDANAGDDATFVKGKTYRLQIAPNATIKAKSGGGAWPLALPSSTVTSLCFYVAR